MELITDIDAERRIISAMLNSEAACDEALSTINENVFSSPLIRQTYLLIQSLRCRGVKPSLVEIFREGHDLGFITGVERVQEVQQIAEAYIDEENISYWVNRVKQASGWRRLQKLATKLATDCSAKLKGTHIDLTYQDYVKQVGGEIVVLAMDTDSEDFETGKEIAELGEQEATAKVEKWRRTQEDYKILGQPVLDGVPTGYPTLNNITLGYKPADLIILGAQTGHGKTAFALNAVNAVCIESKIPLLYVNTEMSRKQIAARLGAILSQIPLQKIRTGNLTDGELYQVQTSFKILNNSGLFISHVPNLTPDKLQALARKAKMQHDIQLLILDYVGRMEKRDPKYQEWQVLEDIVRACKIMAQNLDIAVMCLVQLNPDGSLQGAKRMENECDLMLQLLPLGDEDNIDERRTKFEKKYGKTFEPDFNYYLRIKKSRDSEASISIPLVFDKARQQIREAREASKASAWNDVGRAVEGGRK